MSEVKQLVDELLDAMLYEHELSPASTLPERAATAITALQEELATLREANDSYTYIGRDGEPILAKELEQQLVETKDLLEKSMGNTNVAIEDFNAIKAQLSTIRAEVIEECLKIAKMPLQEGSPIPPVAVKYVNAIWLAIRKLGDR
jgi:hypothetical protein